MYSVKTIFKTLNRDQGSRKWGVSCGALSEKPRGISSEILQVTSQRMLWRMRREISSGGCFRSPFRSAHKQCLSEMNMSLCVLQGKPLDISSEIVQAMSQRVLWRIREEISIEEWFWESFYEWLRECFEDCFKKRFTDY